MYSAAAKAPTDIARELSVGAFVTDASVHQLGVTMSFVHRRCSSLAFALAMSGLLSIAGCSSPDKINPTEYEIIDHLVEQHLQAELTEFVAIPTYRDASLTEAQTVANLKKLRDTLLSQTEAFNAEQKSTKLESFEWKGPVQGEDREHWVFGLRVGNGPYRLALSSHLDTVPPGTNPNWKPFELTTEKRNYLGKDQDFFVGRGTIDDKGPAVLAFQVLKAIAKRYDGDPRLANVTLELIFDTSEETDMSMPYYFQAEPAQMPNLAVIYDAMWCVRAEKGIERPVFSIARSASPVSSKSDVEPALRIVSLNTPNGPTNQIPDTATAVITGEPAAVKAFAAEVQDKYNTYPFDDSNYRRAKLTSKLSDAGDSLELTTLVEGAQHGSAPQENRENGSNPLVSLANFLAGLANENRVLHNEVARMSQFIAWMWGTKVLGEHHPELLQRDDDVFQKGNGTTYALTRLYTNPSNAPDRALTLSLDIRYALGHHSTSWDGKTEGLLPGNTSIFATQVWPPLVEQFNAQAAQGESRIEFQTRTSVGPDVRLTTGTAFSTVSRAYEAVMGTACPPLAIGGATDAKGNLNFIAAGALFTEKFGPPVNFHGFNEGAPVQDLKLGGRILYKMLVNQIENQSR